MPLIYSRNNIRSRDLSSRALLQMDYQEMFDEEDDDEEDYIHSLPLDITDNSSESSEITSSSSSSSSSSNSSDQHSIERNNQNINSNNILEEEDEGIITTFIRSRVDIYRLSIRTSSEILEDLAAIIRILRQINSLHRVFNHSRNSFISGILRSYRSNLSNNNTPIQSLDDNDLMSEEDEEANKLLEAGLEDLQSILASNENINQKQSTLALLSLITYQYNHCSEDYLKKYLDPNGDYNPTLAILAAATAYHEESTEIKSCRDIILAAEEIYGPDWLKEFHKGKEGTLRNMLEKLTFVAKIRLKVRDLNPSVIR